MPKLIEYVSIGFCSGYGDGDWRIPMSIQNLSRKQMDELMVTMFHAQRNMWDLWSRGQLPEPQASAAQENADE